jgi:hypothetical protein
MLGGHIWQRAEKGDSMYMLHASMIAVCLCITLKLTRIPISGSACSCWLQPQVVKQSTYQLWHLQGRFLYYPQGQQRRLTEIRSGGECQNSHVEIIILLAPDHIVRCWEYIFVVLQDMYFWYFLACRLRLLLEGKLNIQSDRHSVVFITRYEVRMKFR